MVRRWWLLFRSTGVITVLFLTPIRARQLHAWSYYLSTTDAVAELALEISVVLFLEAAVAALLALFLSTGRGLKLLGDRADTNCAGLLAFASTIFCLMSLATPVGMALIFPMVSPRVSIVLILALIASIPILGWRRSIALLNGFNQSSQIVLAAACPLLLVLVFAGGIGWRGFDPMPQARHTESVPGKPNVVLITFDALTAQDMSLYGYRLPTTPQFERLANH
ncbi:MAG: hypothetical protein ACREQI_15540 [Candidatus Binataceae bacterium]